MQTFFTPKQLKDKNTKRVNYILRTCVHCGICTTSCPTYLETRDERNSPRGRIYLLKLLFESNSVNNMKASQKFLDYCLNCGACETACPSGVEYQELTSIGRKYLDQQRIRSKLELLWRKIIIFFLTSTFLMRLTLFCLRPIKKIFPNKSFFKIIHSVPSTEPTFLYKSPEQHPKNITQEDEILLAHGCVGSLIRPSIHKTSKQILEKLGYKVHTLPSDYCCGSLASHSGLSNIGQKQANSLKRYVNDLKYKSESQLKLVTTISGCSKQLEEQCSLPAWEFAHFISQSNLEIDKNQQQIWKKKRIAWHTPCSLRHGLKTHDPIELLWKRWGLNLVQPVSSSICCGAAGAYMIFQSDMSETLKQNKLHDLNKLQSDCIVTHNIGCLEHLRYGLNCPIYLASEFIAILSGIMTHEKKEYNFKP